MHDYQWRGGAKLTRDFRLHSHFEFPSKWFCIEAAYVLQVDSVKQHAEYVSQLRRVGKGVGVYIFDKELEEGEGA